MKRIKGVPQKIIISYTAGLLGLFLLFPMLTILVKSFFTDGTFSFGVYQKLFLEEGIGRAFINSVGISATSGLLTTVLAFVIAYTVNYTNLSKGLKKAISVLVMLPMLLPTITYGFAIIYTFGKQGLITKLIGSQIIDVYSLQGLGLGYVIYTLPISFMLINNAIGYIDKKFMTVSRLMGDGKGKTFVTTVLRPLAGNVDLLSTRLYNEMLGSLPDFHAGSAVSIIMLIPSIVSIMLITYLKKYNIRYDRISQVELEKNKARDAALGTISMAIICVVLSVFGVIFVIPFVDQWPYRMNFTMENITKMFADRALFDVYKNSLFAASMTAIFGTVFAYSTALVAGRRGEHRNLGKIPDCAALVTNTIPGMVLGVAYLLAFKGTVVHNTFVILIVCNIIHYFSSPYLMMKSGLEKLNASWEITAKLMGDNWIKTVLRIITPNAMVTILEVFEYYFVNAMVTVSAVIFLASTRTMIITAKIKELQHFANFNEIFVLSILILLTNLVVKAAVRMIGKRIGGKNEKTTYFIISNNTWSYMPGWMRKQGRRRTGHHLFQRR